MAYLITASEYLEIGGYPLATPAGRLTDLSALWSMMSRGTNVLIPGEAGVVGTPRRRAPVTMALPGAVFGDFDAEGTATPGNRAGLTANLDELITNVVEPVATGDGSREALWHRGDGTTYTTDLQVERFEVRAAGPVAYRYTLTVTALSGTWTEVEETP